MVEGVKIVAKNLTWRNAGITVLAGVSFNLEPGTVAACVGPNGAGKTTLLNILSGWASPNVGKILIDSRPYSSLTPESAHQLGLARRFDPPKIIKQLTVFDNVCLAAEPAGYEELFDAFFARRRIRSGEKSIQLRAAPILHRLGLGDKLRQQAGSLSVGEQKLLDFALGLLTGPRCLLLDEPLKDRVDDDRKAIVSRELRQFTHDGGSVLVVEHDLHFVRGTADRVLVLDVKGRLAWDGSTQDSETWRVVEQVYRRADDALWQPASVGKVGATPPKPPQTPSAQSTITHRLSASALTVKYEGAAVLNDVTLQLAPGEIVVLRGENGAGKSTLLFALAGIVDAGGTVRLDGEEITDRRADQRSRLGLVLVAQEHKVFPSMTVAENILAGNANGNGSPKSLLKQAFSWFPELRDRATLAASHLSAGQKQMVALARAFLRHARCLLLDEPTSGLDPGVRVRVWNLIRRAAEGGTAVLLVEHVREALDDQIHSTYFLRGGRLEPPIT